MTGWVMDLIPCRQGPAGSSNDRGAARGSRLVCGILLGTNIPTYIDDMQDPVNKAYAAWPTQWYLIGTGGKVVYAGKPGPFELNPAALEKAIQEQVTTLPAK